MRFGVPCEGSDGGAGSGRGGGGEASQAKYHRAGIGTLIVLAFAITDISFSRAAPTARVAESIARTIGISWCYGRTG